MAADSLKNSFSDEISFSEWQFVGKSNCEFSDDESIEIIEREVLHCETSSSCSEEEKEDEPVVVIKKGEGDEPEVEKLVVTCDSNSGISLDSDVKSLLNNTLEIEPSQSNTDQNTLHRSYTPKESHVTANSINNFSLKVLYSCALAAVISVVIHQYRGNLLDIFLTCANEIKFIASGLSAIDDYHEPTEWKQISTDFKIPSDDEVVLDFESKRQKFKTLCSIYEWILINTFIPKSNIYAVQVTNIQDLFFRLNVRLLISGVCKDDIDSMELPTVCEDSKGKVLLFMTKEEYHQIMRTSLLPDTSPFEHPMQNFLLNLMERHYESSFLESQSDEIIDFQKERKNSEMDFNNIRGTDSVDKIPMKEATTSTENKNKVDLSDIPEKPEGESKLQEVIEEVRTLYRKIKDQVENLDRIWTTCTDSSQDSCILKKKSASEQNEPVLNEAKKNDTIHNEESETDRAVLEFIYETPPVTDRWTSKMDSETSADTNHHDKSSEELFTKTGKTREKYRNRNNERSDRKKAQKTRKLSDETEHELYKRYKEFLSQTGEKIKVDYKKFASHFKSKLKKFGDGVKRNYEKLISSNWKHYAKNVLQSFNF